MSVRLRSVSMLDRNVKEAVAQRVPEIEHAVVPARQEARAEHHVGFTLAQAARAVACRSAVVLEIGVLDRDEVTGRVRDTGPQRGALALIAGVMQYFDA